MGAESTFLTHLTHLTHFKSTFLILLGKRFSAQSGLENHGGRVEEGDVKENKNENNPSAQVPP